MRNHYLPSELSYKEGELQVERVPVRLIAREFGTPCYVYSLTSIRNRVAEFHRALRNSDHILCFSVKANSNGAILRFLVQQGLGFDIVSGGELFRVLRAGATPSRIVFSGVGKSEEELRQALEAGILLFNVESRAELDRLQHIAKLLGVRPRVALRVNPDVDPKTHPYISTGLRKSKFGIPIQHAYEAYAYAKSLEGIEVAGIDCHIGSQLTDLAPFREALTRVSEITMDLRSRGITLRYLDVGGGLGVRYDTESPPSIGQYVACVLDVTRDLGMTVIFEPGRVLVADAGLLVTSVVYRKSTTEKRFVVVDGAMNDLIRPALYGSYQEIVPVRPREGPSEIVDVVGPVCETGDFLGKDREVSPLESGDLVAVLGAGAYGFVMASNYNSRRRPPEVLVDGDRFAIVRQRDSYADLIEKEQVPAWLG